MHRNTYKPVQIITKSREAEVLLSQGATVKETIKEIAPRGLMY